MARHRMACGESDELAHGTVTAVTSRDPHPCLSQGLSTDSPETVYARLRDLSAPMLKNLQNFSYKGLTKHSTRLRLATTEAHSVRCYLTVTANGHPAGWPFSF